MALRPGSIITVSFPFTDLSAVKRRPALAVHVHGDDLLVCGMTSRLSGRRDAVVVGSDDMAEGRLPKASEVRPLKLFTVHRSLVRTVVGRVTDETFDRAVSLLTAALHRVRDRR